MGKGMSRQVSLKTAVLACSLTTVFFLLLMLFILQVVSVPSFLKFTVMADSFVLTDTLALSNQEPRLDTSILLTQGKLISLDDLWSFQSSFYQTLITFLIGINGLIGVVAFFYIKSSSEEKAHDAAINHINAGEYKDHILKHVHDDYDDTIRDLVGALDDNNESKLLINMVHQEQAELKRQIRVISSRIAELDVADREGSGLSIE